MPQFNQSGFIQSFLLPVVVASLLAVAGFIYLQNRPSVNTAVKDIPGQPTESTAAAAISQIPQPATFSSDINVWKSYTDNKSGVSIKYPPAWHQQDGMKFHTNEYLTSSVFLNDTPQMSARQRKMEINVYPMSLDEVKKLLKNRHQMLKLEVKTEDINLAGRDAVRTELLNIEFTPSGITDDKGAGSLTREIMADANKLNYFIMIDEKNTLEISYGADSADIAAKMIDTLTFTK